MITRDSVIICDGVIDGAAKFYNDASETAPINFILSKNQHIMKWIIIIVIIIIIFYTLFY